MASGWPRGWGVGGKSSGVNPSNETPPTALRGSRQRKRPRHSSRVRRCPMAFVPGAAGGAMRACPPERSTTRSHSGPPRPIPDANSLPSASHELSHGAQASTPAPAKPNCPTARARRGTVAFYLRCLPHDPCRCRHPLLRGTPHSHAYKMSGPDSLSLLSHLVLHDLRLLSVTAAGASALKNFIASQAVAQLQLAARPPCELGKFLQQHASSPSRHAHLHVTSHLHWTRCFRPVRTLQCSWHV